MSFFLFNSHSKTKTKTWQPKHHTVIVYILGLDGQQRNTRKRRWPEGILI